MHVGVCKAKKLSRQEGARAGARAARGLCLQAPQRSMRDGGPCNNAPLTASRPAEHCTHAIMRTLSQACSNGSLHVAHCGWRRWGRDGVWLDIYAARAQLHAPCTSAEGRRRGAASWPAIPARLQRQEPTTRTPCHSLVAQALSACTRWHGLCQCCVSTGASPGENGAVSVCVLGVSCSGAGSVRNARPAPQTRGRGTRTLRQGVQRAPGDAPRGHADALRPQWQVAAQPS